MCSRDVIPAAREQGHLTPPPRPARFLFQGAGDPVTLHGHRLSSLYRVVRKDQIPFTILKILKKLRIWLALASEYFLNREPAGEQP